MAFLRQCLQLQRLRQGHDALEMAWNTEDMADASEGAAETHDMKPGIPPKAVGTFHSAIRRHKSLDQLNPYEFE